MMAFQFPIANGKKKALQVFECPKETWKGKGKDKSRRTVLNSQNESKEDKPEMSLSQEIKKEFEDTLSSVKDFANSHLKGKEKKQFETKKIQLLGGKGPNNRSTPYHILSGIKKKSAVREKKQEEKKKESGVLMGKRKSSSFQSDTPNKKNKYTDYGIQATKGRFKNGVLDVRSL